MFLRPEGQALRHVEWTAGELALRGLYANTCSVTAPARSGSVLLIVLLSSAIGAAPATRPSPGDRERELQLSRDAVALIDQHKFADAEALLRKALELVPDNTT